ncbi:MAG TPA: galactose oxidase-like domain-containing protein, partial [Thermoanaerobaculia bacterium]|nr:galactose oxidase-like domain-containing protein [Thermoanaerobaculia bacterium]
MHAAMLPTGHIVYFSGSEYNHQQHNRGQIGHTRLYEWATGSIRHVPSPPTDLFCCGHALLSNGRLLVAGGTEDYPLASGHHQQHWPGTRDAWIYDFPSRHWVRIARMNEAPNPRDWIEGGRGGGRWYPTLVTLSDGNVLAMSGHPSHTDRRHSNNTPEIYTVPSDQWSVQAPLGAESFGGVPVQYPRLHVLPGGDVFCVTPLDVENRSLRYNPTTQQKTYVGQAFTNPDYLGPAIANGQNTTSVLLPLLASQGYRARILLCGSTEALRIEPDEPNATWQRTHARTLAGSPRRFNLNAVLLPTGEVFVSGGVSNGNLRDETAVTVAEMYDPATDQWKTLERAEVVRNYHSVALLLPDGRVWTAGSNRDHVNSTDQNDTRELRIEIYDPWYSNHARPLITSVPFRVGHGETFNVLTPQARNITRVALVRAGSTTHAFDSDQRWVEATFTRTGEDRLLVTAPSRLSIAPPGAYLLFLLDRHNVPSVGHFIQLHGRGFSAPRAAHETNFAVSPISDLVEVFWIAPDSRVVTNTRDPDINNAHWNTPTSIAPAGSADTRSGIVSVSPTPGIVEVFWVRSDGMVLTNGRDPNINDGNWNNPISDVEPNAGSADPRTGVAAVCPSAGTVEVFWIHRDGRVLTNARDPGINNGNWNNPISDVEPNAGSADPRSCVAAICPSRGTVEVFWIRSDGIVFSNARDP